MDSGETETHKSEKWVMKVSNVVNMGLGLNRDTNKWKMGPCNLRLRSQKNTTTAALRNAEIGHFLQFKIKTNYDPNAHEICMDEHMKCR